MAKRRVLLVDDEVTVLLTLKAVLEISGFDVDTAASAREARSKIKLHEYQMVITDMRMESDAAGREVIQAARTAAYHPAVALLTAFPDDDWADIGADKMLVKPMQTAVVHGWNCRYDLQTGKFDVPALFSSDNAKVVMPE